MAKGKASKPIAPQDRYAKRFPGGVPLHGGGEMFQWSKVGQELVGEFVGIKPYKRGHIANMRTEDGVVAFSAPTILAGILQGVRPGSKIAVVFAEEDDTNTKRGQNPLKKFEVYALDEEEETRERDDEGEGEEDE